jgi:hypothetical protein
MNSLFHIYFFRKNYDYPVIFNGRQQAIGGFRQGLDCRDATIARPAGGCSAIR